MTASDTDCSGGISGDRQTEEDCPNDVEVNIMQTKPGCMAGVEDGGVRQGSSVVGPHVKHISWLSEVPRQTAALTRKNTILARRSVTSTLVRTCSSVFFMLMIYLVNQGLKARYETLPYFQDLKDSSGLRKPIPGIPACERKAGRTSCVTFAFTPAPWDEYVPERDYDTVRKFAEVVRARGVSSCSSPLGPCDSAACQAAQVTPAHGCARCCEMWRVHRVVRSIMKHNGSGVGVLGSADTHPPTPIPADKVRGFVSQQSLDGYLLREPEYIQVHPLSVL